MLEKDSRRAASRGHHHSARLLRRGHHDFEQKEAPTFNRIMMGYALRLSLFVGVVSAERAELLAVLPLVAFLAAAFSGMYAAVLLLGIFVLRRSPGLSALRALTAAAPSTAFAGTPVLG